MGDNYYVKTFCGWANPSDEQLMKVIPETTGGVFFLPFFFFFFPSHLLRIIFALYLSLPRSRNSDPGPHSRLFLPPYPLRLVLAQLRRRGLNHDYGDI